MERRPALIDGCAQPGDVSLAREMAGALKKILPGPGWAVRWRYDDHGGRQHTVRRRTAVDERLEDQDFAIAQQVALWGLEQQQRTPLAGGKIVGHAIVTGLESLNLGGFVEIIDRSALNRTFKEKIDVRALLDHNAEKRMGRLLAGTVDIKIDAQGLHFVNDPPDTSYARDAVASIRRGDLSGASFSFQTHLDEWFLRSDGVPLRRVLDMTVREISLVTWPAYPQTSVEIGERALPSGRPRLQRSGSRVPMSLNLLRLRLAAAAF